MVSACQFPGELFARGNSAYDGAWVGIFQMSVGTRECTIKRGGIRAKIEGGEISGFARFAARHAPFTGIVNDSGGIDYGLVKTEFTKDNAEIVGQFGDVAAEGTWESKNCRGTWNLRKVR